MIKLRYNSYILIFLLVVISNLALASAGASLTDFTLRLSPNPVTIGMYRDLTITGAEPNSDIFIYCTDPVGNERCNGWNIGKTDSNGFLVERELVTSEFELGTWCAYAKVGDKLSNTDCYTLIALGTRTGTTILTGNPTLRLSPNPVAIGTYRDLTVRNAAPNSQVLVYCIDPSGNEQCNGLNFGTTDSNGFFAEREIVTSNFATGTWCAYARIGNTNGPITNVDCYNVTSTAITTDFSLNVLPLSITATQGSSSTILVSASPNTFNSPITLSVSNLPAGVIASFSQNIINPAQGTSLILSISVLNNVAPGNYFFTITGTATSGVVKTQQVQLTVLSATGGIGGGGGGGTGSGTVSVTGSIASRLLISDIDVKIDGRKSSVRSDGRISRDAEPGSSLELRIEVKNNFTKAEDLEIEDIEIRVTIDGIDDGDDLEEESNRFNLDAQDDKTAVLKFDIPINVDEDTFDITIEAEGEDENGTEQRQTAEIELDIQKERHDLRFLSFNANPLTANCKGSLSIDYSIINIGSEDEENLMVEIKSDDLGLNIAERGIQLEEGTEDNIFSKSIKADIEVENQAYQVTASLFADNGELSDRKTIEFEVVNCVSTEELGEVVFLEQGKSIEETKTIKEEIPSTQILFKDADRNTWFVALGILAFIIIVVVTIIVLYVVFG